MHTVSMILQVHVTRIPLQCWLNIFTMDWEITYSFSPLVSCAIEYKGGILKKIICVRLPHC